MEGETTYGVLNSCNSTTIVSTGYDNPTCSGTGELSVLPNTHGVCVDGLKSSCSSGAGAAAVGVATALTALAAALRAAF